MTNTPLWAKKKIREVKEKQLKKLDLTYYSWESTKLTKIPPEIFELKWLEKLDLSGNNIPELPNILSHFPKLRLFGFRWQENEPIPDWIHLVSALKVDLSLFNINISNKLPDFIFTLTNLNSLNLNSNKLTSIPDSITQLTNLNSLDLSDNQLTSIPDPITQLTNLNSLDLRFNKLTSIPDSITQLTNLNSLYLSYNQLTSIPDSISQLTNLNSLDLSENPLEKPPIEIAIKGIYAIREYFRQLIEEGKDYIYEAKLIIVGAGEAGKTTLAKKIINPKYKLHSQEASTEGIEILQWSFPIEDKQREKRNFRVNIWDFGGQEIYHTTHQFFLTKRSLYILVADTRKEDTDFPYWLNITQLLSNHSPLIIVKNEKGDRTVQINEKQLRGQFLHLKEVLACNLANSRGLNYILENCQFHLRNLPHVGDTLPKTWKQVREILEQDTRNYISLQEYLKICEENGFKNHEDKVQLSGYLHDLGIVLHFQEDWILSQTVILKPEWGTDAVYKVLDNKEVINNLGEFSNHKLRKIWYEEKYAGKQIELLQLMKKFQLCYQLPGTNDTYIAPQLLTQEQPTYNWDGANNLILRYTYEFMPKGIITQFIVAMHQKIDNQKCVWRTGVILNQNQTKAEVIEFYDKREIKIRVTGKYKRDLMTNVTYELDKIHDSYKHLKYQKLIPCNCSVCKSTQSPYFYKYDELRERHINHKYTIECGKPPYNTVEVLELIDDVLGKKNFLEQENTNKKEIDEFITSTLKKIAEKQQPTNQTTIYVKNVNAINTGKGNINNPIQNIIEANLDEINNLIQSLKTHIQAFPEEQKNNIEITIDDLESDLADEKKRQPNRLKTRLLALWGAACLISGSVAGVADFSNNVLELSEKLEIPFSKEVIQQNPHIIQNLPQE